MFGCAKLGSARPFAPTPRASSCRSNLIRFAKAHQRSGKTSDSTLKLASSKLLGQKRTLTKKVRKSSQVKTFLEMLVDMNVNHCMMLWFGITSLILSTSSRMFCFATNSHNSRLGLALTYKFD